jgi:hypothetical protein
MMRALFEPSVMPPVPEVGSRAAATSATRVGVGGTGVGGTGVGGTGVGVTTIAWTSWTMIASSGMNVTGVAVATA